MEFAKFDAARRSVWKRFVQEQLPINRQQAGGEKMKT